MQRAIEREATKRLYKSKTITTTHYFGHRPSDEWCEAIVTKGPDNKNIIRDLQRIYFFVLAMYLTLLAISYLDLGTVSARHIKSKQINKNERNEDKRQRFVHSKRVAISNGHATRCVDVTSIVSSVELQRRQQQWQRQLPREKIASIVSVDRLYFCLTLTIPLKLNSIQWTFFTFAFFFYSFVFFLSLSLVFFFDIFLPFFYSIF